MLSGLNIMGFVKIHIKFVSDELFGDSSFADIHKMEHNVLFIEPVLIEKLIWVVSLLFNCMRFVHFMGSKCL